jgi:predicted amidohydrolase
MEDVTGKHPVTLAVVQMDCALGDVEGNLASIAHYSRAAAELGADLVVFPECATTGYFVAERLTELAEPPDGHSSRRLSEIARTNRIHLAVGLIITEEGRFYDAQTLHGPDGQLLGLYRKAHLFSLEKQQFSAGDCPSVVETQIGRIGMSICYDLIFSEYIRGIVDLGADIVINSTDWITNSYQSSVWGWSGKTTQGLAATRALENGVFLGMANRVGREAGFDSLGWSCIVAPSGMFLGALKDEPGIVTATFALQSEDLEKWRAIATNREDRRPDLYRS